ncbi:MAG: hypothetical protein VYA06_00825 [Chloroflexota bacterium]|nr:hypothetical protein [Chloroflexota bacterium]|tara:strand:- start:1364 stop:2002 length:639 start_codon:yes stop_codon:yes gene_type:complete
MMAQLGNYKIPEITLDKCLEVSNVINKQKNRTIGRIAFSQLLEMSHRGGQFSKLINSCKIWGIIDGRESYSLTELGINALNPLNSNYLIDSKKELILNVPFYSTLYLNYPNITHTETTLLQTIEEITGVDRLISLKFENIIRRTISEINPIIQTFDSELNLKSDPGSNKVNKTSDKVNISTSGINVDFPFNDEGINAAIALLNSLKISNKIN